MTLRRPLLIVAMLLAMLPYSFGQTGQANDVRALQAKAEQGDALSQDKLGLMYKSGQGVSQDYFEALRWYRKAAEQVFEPAQFNLAAKYFLGEGVTQDYVQTYMWVSLALKTTAADQEKFAEALDAVARNMTPAQITEAQRLALAWTPKAPHGSGSDSTGPEVPLGRGGKPSVGNGSARGPYRIGNGVSAPTAVNMVEPEYSEKARKSKRQGTVLLQFVVDDQGRPKDFKILHSLGLGLDENAIEAVGKWSFKPGMKDGSPVSTLATIEVNFRLISK